VFYPQVCGNDYQALARRNPAVAQDSGFHVIGSRDLTMEARADLNLQTLRRLKFCAYRFGVEKL
jgi:hypothetical protein